MTLSYHPSVDDGVPTSGPRFMLPDNGNMMRGPAPTQAEVRMTAYPAHSSYHQGRVSQSPSSMPAFWSDVREALPNVHDDGSEQYEGSSPITRPTAPKRGYSGARSGVAPPQHAPSLLLSSAPEIDFGSVMDYFGLAKDRAGTVFSLDLDETIKTLGTNLRQSTDVAAALLRETMNQRYHYASEAKDRCPIHFNPASMLYALLDLCTDPGLLETLLDLHSKRQLSKAEEGRSVDSHSPGSFEHSVPGMVKPSIPASGAVTTFSGPSRSMLSVNARRPDTHCINH